jgi:hypothetical protein
MKFTNAERQVRKRENKILRGVKQVLGIYVPEDLHDELKPKIIKYAEKLAGEKNE